MWRKYGTGFFHEARQWIDLERFLYTFYDDHKLIEDMMDQILFLNMTVAKRVLEEVKVDWVRTCEDVAYKSGPLISPDMFGKFIVPRYKQTLTFFIAQVESKIPESP